MPITEIMRDWGTNPSMVRLTSTDSLTTVLGSSYLSDQADNLEALNHGAFAWKDNDAVLVNHANGQNLLTYDLASTSFKSGAYGVKLTTTVVITAAEMLALAASPKTLVAAPGAGLYLRLVKSDFTLNYNTTAYTITNAGDDLAIRYTDGAGAIASETLQAQGFLDETEDAFLFGQAIGEIGGEMSDLLNQPLVLDNIGAAEYTNGDSPVYATIEYLVVTPPF